MSPEMERKKAENARWFEQKQRECKADFDRKSQQMRQDHPKANEKPPFNAASAPPPDECLRAFVAAARNATSVEQILPFLPSSEQRVLKQRQSSYDPKHAASAREWHRKQNPNISNADLAHITGAPGDFELRFNRGLANEIRDILSVKTEGDKATLVVSTNSEATINGEHYSYGKATVEMVGEGNYWKLSRYSPSIVYYKEPPQH